MQPEKTPSRRRPLARFRFDNPALLIFLAQVDAHARTGEPLGALSGLDPLEVAIATAEAEARLFVAEAPEDMAPVRLTLTAAGRSWARAEVGPIADLIAGGPA